MGNYYRTESTGTENYYEHQIGMLITDGIKEMAEKLQAWWSIDAVWSYLNSIRKIDDRMFVCRVHKTPGNSGKFVIDNGNGHCHIIQNIEYTDIESNVKMYLFPEGKRWILIMPEEY